jgi:hypothetical protein
MEGQIVCSKCKASMDRIPQKPLEKFFEFLLLGFVKIKKYKCYGCFRTKTIFVRN